MSKWIVDIHGDIEGDYDLICKADDVFDKMKAEIWNLEEGISSYHNDRPWLYKDEVLQIIDKYKKEVEK